MTIIRVPGVALPEKKRQRRFANGQMGFRTDTPDRKDFKARLAYFAKQVCPAPLEGPLVVDITIRKPKPPSWPKNPCKSNPWPWAWWKKPDRSNYMKIIEDALTGIAWVDDAQIIGGYTGKEWGPDEVVVTIAPAVQHYQGGNGSEGPAGDGAAK
jgi:Holliday junction resolvase RusA-like endonuclease